MSIFESIRAERILTKERKQELLAALQSELHQIQRHLETQQKWLSDLRSDLGKNTYSPVTHIPFQRAVYDRYVVELHSAFEVEDQRLLHLAYSYLAHIDSTLEKFDSVVEESRKTYAVYQPYAGAQMRLDKLQQRGRMALDIVNHHLTGAPLQYPHAATHLA